MKVAGIHLRRLLAAHRQFGLGTFYRSAREASPARRHLAQAMELYNDMDMASWLNKTEAEVRQVDLVSIENGSNSVGGNDR